jgi:hypothetical protein
MVDADLDYGKFTGRLALTIGDGEDGGDNPDTIWCDTGIVKIRPLTSSVKVASAAAGPFTAGQATIEATVDSNGYITFQGKPYVWVVDLTSPKVNPVIGPNKATHQITFLGVSAQGVPVLFESVYVRITKDGPNGDGINDITVLAPVAVAGAQPIFRGERGVSVAGATIDGGQLVLELSDGSTVAADGELPIAPGGSNAGVASYVTTPGPTKDALTATFVPLITLAKNPDLLVTGALTYAAGLLASAVVKWPDGKAGVLTITSRQPVTGAVTGYTITHVDGTATLTYTQPTITRDSSGNATAVPQITVT